MKPISPKEAKYRRGSRIPPEVIDAFNELIEERFDGHSATILQNEALARICQKKGCSEDEVIEKHWLDVEPIYRKAGWKVEYDKPGYNEPYEAFFEFTA